MSDANANDVADRLHSAAIHLLRWVRREDEHSGLTAARLSAMSVLAFGGPVTIGRLAEMEQVRSPTMVRIVDHLVDAGLAQRVSDPEDRRRTLVRATPDGKALLVEGRQRRVRVLTEALDDLPDEDLATLRKAAELLDRIAGGQV